MASKLRSYIHCIEKIQRDIQSPPKYDGTSDSIEFIIKFKFICANNNWTKDKVKVDSLIICFLKSALHWFLGYRDKQGSTVFTYSQLEKAFLKAFPSSRTFTTLSEDITDRYEQKPGQNPIAYVYSKQYYLLASDPSITEICQVRRTISKLQPEYLETCHLLQPQTIEQLVENIHTIQDSIHMKVSRAFAGI